MLPSEDFVATPKASRQDLIQYLALGGILLGGLAWASRPAPRLHSPLPDPRPGASMEEILVDAWHQGVDLPPMRCRPEDQEPFRPEGALVMARSGSGRNTRPTTLRRHGRCR